MTFNELFKEVKKLYRDSEIERDNAILFERHGKICMCVFYDKDFLGYELYERYVESHPIRGGYAPINNFKRHNHDPEKILNIIKTNHECKNDNKNKYTNRTKS